MKVFLNLIMLFDPFEKNNKTRVTHRFKRFFDESVGTVAEGSRNGVPLHWIHSSMDAHPL